MTVPETFAIDVNRTTNAQAIVDARQSLEDIASPISVFIRECCDVGLDHSTSTDRLYDAYRVWASRKGLQAVSSPMLGRALSAALPGVKKIRPRTEDGREYVYAGIRLLGENGWT